MNGQIERRVEPSPVENPFSTRFTRPGALPFLFEAGESTEAIVAKFVAAGRRGAIVGPHGSGKSTLLASLLPALHDAGMKPIVHTLHDGQRRLPRGFAAPARGDDVLILDGYEQLSWWGRREVRKAVERVGAGLLATAHAPLAGLPTLCETRPTWETTRRAITELTPSLPAFHLADDELRRLYEQCGGNVRELCFKLYDLYESRRS